MFPNLIIQESLGLPVYDQEVEIVERKGEGHPDTICDAVAEHISIALSKAYKEALGYILHHNIDKGFLVAGQVECRMGGGRVIEPMRLVIGDRATVKLGRTIIPVAELAVDTAKAWIKDHLPHVDPNRHLSYQIELKPASAELGDIFARPRGLLVANDTSAAVGHAPFTPTEKLVLQVEQYLNGSTFKMEFPETGQDVKVMGVRVYRELTLTIAMPLLAKAIKSEIDYFARRTKIQKAIKRYVARHSTDFEKITIRFNALDRPKKGIAGMYLTLLGTSAEHGDSGQVGRGNRVNGLISLNWPMSGEAAAGKNPVSHIGKIYNVLAHQLAEQIYSQVPPVQEVTVWLTSKIGQRIDRPAIVSVQMNLKKGARLQDVRKRVQSIVQEKFNNLPSFCEDLSEGRFPVY